MSNKTVEGSAPALQAEIARLEAENQQLRARLAELERSSTSREGEPSRETEAVLNSMRERFELVLKGSNDAPWDWDLLTNELYYSPQWWRQLGFATDEEPADAALWERLMHPDDAEHVNAVFGGALAEHDSYEVEFRLRHKDGHYIPVLSRGFITRDASGKPVRVSGTNMDLTARKAVEEDLARSEERTRAILDATPFPVAVVDLDDNRIEYWSRSALEIFGHTPPTTAEWYALAYPDAAYRQDVLERWRPVVDKARATGRAINGGEFRVSCKDGSVRICELYAAVIRDNLIVTFNDITDRKAMEAQLAQADRLASMGTLASSVAHEINNPLTFVVYNLESLDEDLPELLRALEGLHEHRDEFRPELQTLLAKLAPAHIDDILSRLDDARDGSLRILEIARGLSSFSRVDADVVSPVELVDVVEAACRMASNEIRYRAHLVKKLSPVPTLRAKKGQLSQVLLNLLLNAAHAIEEGAIDANEIKVTTSCDDDWAYLTVEDSGHGIPASHRDRLFEPFFTTKKIGDGSGLGLAISRNIVESHGGSISIESEVGRGTQVMVSLPLTLDIPASESEAPGDTPRARGRVLVVDDEASVRSIIARLLEGHEIVEAPDGEHARRLLEGDQTFDLILCDMMMPGLSGMDLHGWLREQHPPLAAALVFMTGGVFTPRARDYLQHVDCLCLEKPFNKARLLGVVNERVRTSQRRRHSSGM